jgi:hypothetical protein
VQCLASRVSHTIIAALCAYVRLTCAAHESLRGGSEEQQQQQQQSPNGVQIEQASSQLEQWAEQELARMEANESSGESRGRARRLVIVLHGMESSSTSPLTKRFAQVGHAAYWHTLAHCSTAVVLVVVVVVVVRCQCKAMHAHVIAFRGILYQ